MRSFKPEIHLYFSDDNCSIHVWFSIWERIWEKGPIGNFFYKLDSRETSLLNAANHFKIFLIEFEICLYEHLYFLYIRNPLFPIVASISMFWQLKVNMFYPKSSFPIV